ncbi:MAG TPA: sigma-70 family RNA polymerase sigma factor [Candidatus Udaeobacter sp.]|jgi:RNA polymerase sigma-70 factor (ECF subfamily)|nr:sigma-70 family RNA polymerase sigma factor [Candidatus Udaeobacter sp.]
MLREQDSGRSDDELAAASQRDPGSPAAQQALSLLISRWSERTYRWAYRYLGEREQSLDLAQDCLLQMIQALPRYRASGRFSAWLFMIVHNRCLDELRRRRPLPEPEAGMDAFETAETGPEEIVDLAIERERVLAVMNARLEPEERLALWLRAYEETSVEDITRLLNLDGASGARGLLQTARRKLRAALSEES